MEFLFIIFAWVICGAVGYLLGKQRGKDGLGFVLGFVLGPIGWIIVLILPAEKEPERRLQVHAPREDPLEAWDREQRTKAGPPPAPEHLRGKKWDEEGG